MGKWKLFLSLVPKVEAKEIITSEWNGRDSDELCDMVPVHKTVYEYTLEVTEVTPSTNRKAIIEAIYKALEPFNASIKRLELDPLLEKWEVKTDGLSAVYSISEEEYNYLNYLKDYGKLVVCINHGMRGLSIDGVSTSMSDACGDINDPCEDKLASFIEELDLLEGKWDERYLH